MNPAPPPAHPYPTQPAPIDTLDSTAQTTLKEMSREVAVAGIQARHRAIQEGADPAQMDAVLDEAVRTAPPGAIPINQINGVRFHRMTLAVTLGYRRMSALIEAAPEPVDEIAQVAAMAAVLADPVGTRKLDLDGLITRGLEITGDWESEEIDHFRRYLEALAPVDRQQ